MAWRFAEHGEMTVLAIVGDPVPESQWAKRPKLRGARCGLRTQGIRLRKNDVELSERIAEGFACADGGLDEKEFWLFGHPGRTGTKTRTQPLE